eukprot:539888-Rhodomonas_salina.2
MVKKAKAPEQANKISFYFSSTTTANSKATREHLRPTQPQAEETSSAVATGTPKKCHTAGEEEVEANTASDMKVRAKKAKEPEQANQIQSYFASSSQDAPPASLSRQDVTAASESTGEASDPHIVEGEFEVEVISDDEMAAIMQIEQDGPEEEIISDDEMTAIMLIEQAAEEHRASQTEFKPVGGTEAQLAQARSADTSYNRALVGRLEEACAGRIFYSPAGSRASSSLAPPSEAACLACIDAMNLNAQQSEAARSDPDTPLAIVAGAGTGKTKTLTARYLFLLSRGVDSGAVLVVTFTNKAAKEVCAALLYHASNADV